MNDFLIRGERFFLNDFLIRRDDRKAEKKSRWEGGKIAVGRKENRVWEGGKYDEEGMGQRQEAGRRRREEEMDVFECGYSTKFRSSRKMLRRFTCRETVFMMRNGRGRREGETVFTHRRITATGNARGYLNVTDQFDLKRMIKVISVVVIGI